MTRAPTLLDADRSTLLIIDFQARLMPAILEADAVLANAERVIEAARLLGVPAAVTEQNPAGLGPSVEAITARGLPTLHKMYFDAAREDAFSALLPDDRPDIVVIGCEAHVCLMQSVMGVLALGRRVFVVRDAVGSRRAENKEAAIARMVRAGAEVVTTEMVIFEWLATSEHPQFRDVLRLIK